MSRHTFPVGSMRNIYRSLAQIEAIIRIDNSWQGMIRATLLYSAAILSTVSYYTSNCR